MGMRRGMGSSSRLRRGWWGESERDGRVEEDGMLGGRCGTRLAEWYCRGLD
jgi:hypothetical protein